MADDRIRIAGRLATAAAVPSLGVLFAGAVLGPRSCEPGVQEQYLAWGVALAVVLAALPFAVARGWSIPARIGAALLLVAVAAGVWVGGFALGDFRIMCRLF